MDFWHIWATQIRMGVFIVRHHMGLYFFPNNAVIKIDMNLHKNVVIPIFTTRFMKLLYWTSQELKKYLEH